MRQHHHQITLASSNSEEAGAKQLKPYAYPDNRDVGAQASAQVALRQQHSPAGSNTPIQQPKAAHHLKHHMMQAESSRLWS